MHFKILDNQRRERAEINMNSLETTETLNTEATIRRILTRAENEGVTLSRDKVLEELKYRDTDDTSVWSATVDRIILERA